MATDRSSNRAGPNGSTGKFSLDGMWENVKTVVYAVLIAVTIRTVAFEPFNIPSGSMIPTLLVGDYLFVSKFSYGYSRYSLPWSPPLFSGRIFRSQPERGDVAVFRHPSNTDTDYIKRIVGLPGDRIQVRRGILYINDEPVKRRRIEDFIETDRFGKRRRQPRYEETLPNGVSFHVLDMLYDGALDNTPVYTVPSGYFFAMGDNRDNSLDSRAANVGYVPEENLVGRAEFIFFSTDGHARFWEFWNWPVATRYARILQGIS